MYQIKNLEDTIVAISTAMGQGGIGIVRLSGKEAVAIANKLFVAKKNQKVEQFKSYTVHYGWVVDSTGEQIDEVLLTIMRAPHSYTKEDVVEISCHGGIVSLKAIVQLAVDAGARLAEPGEFTKRAFINGRIDLAQAEAVLDIIQSKTDAFLKVSTNQLKGDLSTELESIREILMASYVEMEAIVNFPEDEIDAEGKAKIGEDIKSAQNKVEALLSSSEQGKILKEGIKIVLCGKPNVGKSSLLNVLLKTPRAIVSDVAGTTRDTIEETAQIKGIPFQLIDTAGILDPRDMIEEEAIKRSQMNIESADLILLVLDNNVSLNDEDYNLIERVKGQNVLVLINKSDLDAQLDEGEIQKHFNDDLILKISALQRQGIDQLEDWIVENIWHAKTIDTHGIMISNMRHIQALKDCQSVLIKAQKNLLNNFSLEFVSEDVKVAVNFLDGITGRNIDHDLLDTIFSQFCIGK